MGYGVNKVTDYSLAECRHGFKSWGEVDVIYGSHSVYIILHCILWYSSGALHHSQLASFASRLELSQLRFCVVPEMGPACS